MNEFNNRVDLQRDVIKMLNKMEFKFELTGLSKLAIDRWKNDNNFNNESVLELLYQISSKLYFLANKSQEQITNDYKNLSMDVGNLISNLENELK